VRRQDEASFGCQNGSLLQQDVSSEEGAMKNPVWLPKWQSATAKSFSPRGPLFGGANKIFLNLWLDPATTGDARHGPLPQEVRTRVVDGVPFAWSFHYTQLVPRPQCFLSSTGDLEILRRPADEVASVFASRLVVADLAKGTDGRRWSIEAWPGNCAVQARKLCP
jgi:hypothetical protein